MLATSKMLTQLTPKKFHTFRKRVVKQRRDDLRRMSETFRDIAHEEKKKTKKLVRQHKKFFTATPPASQYHHADEKNTLP